MSQKLKQLSSSWYAPHLACPDCGGSLDIRDEIQCSSCAYKKVPNVMIDLKPVKPSLVQFQFSPIVEAAPEEILNSIEVGRPDICYEGPAAVRDSRELISEISRYVQKGGGVLDLGCGPRDQAGPVEFLGYQYVGIDYSNRNADILADAHAIPFKSETFDCVLSYAVLEHLHNPFVALREIERVLKPRGVYIGTVSQGEPFHQSYFHHTPWGFLSLISAVPSLEIKRLWGSGDTLVSLSRIGRYPKIIKKMLYVIHRVNEAFPWLAPRRMKWPHKGKVLDELYRAGGICFVVQKTL